MKIKIAAGTAILCLIVYLFLVWPRPISLDLEGTAYMQSDPSYSENVSIKIDGQINNPYFGARGFTGQIYCGAIGLDGDYQNLSFDETNKSYLSVIQKDGKRIDMGEIFAGKRMETIVISKGEKILAFPSADREAAENIADQFFAEEYRYNLKNE